ncbi:hypothetical protein VP01_251g8 [Puccinia sorghi]|uniref:Retrovirus-related Pol polyprotein from transposon TNT 1-94 n=1 Tax=Puccinia sorghi TaxID=27349 RepID=A0A0L6V5E5_9BASI|nr:hypothetical protein VP01_251g8 [Puccinia sorghi]
MDLEQTADSISLSQPKLIKKGLEFLKMEDCKPVKTPLSPGVSLISATKEEKEEFKKLNINYRSHTGLLNFLACRTRPDLAPAVSILSSFNGEPGIKHWSQVLHCWKYLKGTMNLKLTLKPDKIESTNAHLDIKMKWLRELKNSNQINVRLIPSEEMVADALTKPSSAESLQRLQARCFLVLFSPN